MRKKKSFNDDSKFQAFFENSSDVVFTLSTDGKILSLNEAFQRMTGWTRAGWLGKSFESLLFADDLAIARKFFRKVVAGKAQPAHELRFVSRDAEILVGLVSTIPYVSEGRVVEILGVVRDITAQKKAENALRDSEAKFRAVTQSAADAVLSADKDGVLIFCNKAAQKIFGFSEKEMLGRPVQQLFATTSRSEFDKIFLAYRITGVQKEAGNPIQLTGLRKDGSQFPLEFSVSSWKWEDKTYFSLILRDITFRRRMLEEYRKSEELLINREKQLIAAQKIAPIGSWEWDLQSNNVVWTDQLYRIFGAEPGTLAPRYTEFLKFIHPDDVQWVDECVRNAIQTTQPFVLEHRVVLKDGSVRFIRAAGEPIVEDGKATKLIGTSQDITDSKKIEQALEKSEEQYRMLFENNPNAMWVFDGETFQFLEVNQRALEQYGYQRHEFLSLTLSDIRHDREPVEPNYRGLRIHRRKDGTLIDVEVVTNKISFHGKPAYLSQVQDVTDRRRAEREVERSRQQLRALAAHLQTIREEERTSIAREIHDELGQVLTGLKMDLVWTERHLNKPGLDPDGLVAKLRGMRELIDNTIKIVRKISADLRPGILDDLGLVAALEWQTQEFQNRSGIRARFRSTLDRSDFHRDAATAMFRIFQETLTNVVRHAQATRLEITLQRQKDFILLKIADNGKGVTPREIHDRQSLGLLGMRERALLLGGDVEIHSVPAGGTLVTVRLPASAILIHEEVAE